MSEYTLGDFSESLNRVDLGAKPIAVLKAWGYSPEGYGSWEGGFVMHLDDGRYAYLSGWCDTSGWGCQDGVNVSFAKSARGLKLPAKISYSQEEICWDRHPADLNRWLKAGMKSDETF